MHIGYKVLIKLEQKSQKILFTRKWFCGKGYKRKYIGGYTKMSIMQKEAKKGLFNFFK